MYHCMQYCMYCLYNHVCVQYLSLSGVCVCVCVRARAGVCVFGGVSFLNIISQHLLVVTPGQLLSTHCG